MQSQYRLVYKDSPFIPCFDKSIVIKEASNLISRGGHPSCALSLSIILLLPVHLNNLCTNSSIMNTYQLGAAELKELDLGYQYPLQTIIASSVCRLYPEEKREGVYHTIIVPTQDHHSLRAQTQILTDLRSTVNLLNLDPSSSLIFEFLKKYPLVDSDYFRDGSEIAAIVFYGLAPDLAKQIGDDSWLTKPYDPTIT